jgi:hypothetical protein
VVAGIGFALVASLASLAGCGGDKSAVTGAGGSANVGGDASTGGSSAGGSNAGGTTGTSTSNPYQWGFYQDAEGWKAGTYPDDGSMAGTNVLGDGYKQTFCDGGCADVVMTFAGDAIAMNFMKYWGSNVDLTNKTLTAKIKVTDDAGLIDIIQLHAQNGSSNSYKWSAIANLNVDSTPSLAEAKAGVVTLSVSLGGAPADTSEFDPAQVQGIGIQVTGVAGATGVAHMYIDYIDVQ